MKKYILLLIFILSVNFKLYSQDQFVGEIRMFAGNFAPEGWALCNGQVLPIAQNTALFSLLGTMYGGNGKTNFALPDLRGRTPVSFGTGSGLTNKTIGESGGSERINLTVDQLPTHTHVVRAVTSNANQSSPTGNFPATTKLLDMEYSDSVPNTTYNYTMLNSTGGNQPINNLQPYVTVNFIIALQGIFPPRQ